MSVDEANNRGLNFTVAAFLAALGVGLVTAVPSEDEFAHKLDEIAIPMVVVTFLVWYFVDRNKYSRSLVPLGTLALVLIMKAFALFVLEFSDKVDRGDDIGIMVVVSAFLVIAAGSYVRPPATTKP